MEEVAASTTVDGRLEGVGVKRRVWKPGGVSSEEDGEVEVRGQSDSPITTVVRERQSASVKTSKRSLELADLGMNLGRL
jgi:hypothetical protein